MRKLATGAALATTLFLAAPAHSAVLVVTDSGTPHDTAGLTGFTTDGADMVGMLVTAFFAGGSSETIAWAATGLTSGASAGTGWTLSESGDTFSANAWTLSASTATIDRLLIEGPPGNTVFDTPFGSSSPGSAGGSAFSTSYSALDITATYFDIVGIGGAAPAGDLYARLEIDFTSGHFTDDSFSFRADTDSAASAGDINPVPEPLTLALAGLGLAAVGGFARGGRRAA